MNILFLHRNFPAQFRHLAAYLAKNNNVVFLTNNNRQQIAGINRIAYGLHREVKAETHHYMKFYEDSLLHGQGALREAIKLKSQGFYPDVIIAHSWGPCLFMKDVFPKSKLICYFEWFYNTYGSDIDFNPNNEITIDTEAKTRIKNSHILVDLYSCDHGISPTKWQKSQFPAEFHHKISVIHDGVDTDYFKPKPNAKLILPDLDLSGKEIITYTTRGMEPYRGFPQFMEAASIIQKRRPDCHIVVAGEDRVCYGSNLPNGKTYKQLMLETFDYDLSRLHFTGSLPYEQYLQVLQASSVHVYLTYPFVLSWSMLEAMSTGCTIIASETAPVKEIIQDGINGILTDFFSPEKTVDKMEEVLNNLEKFQHIRTNARETIKNNYDLKSLLKGQVELINAVIGGQVKLSSAVQAYQGSKIS